MSSTSTTTVEPNQAMDLRHMTSTGALHANQGSRRVSQRISSRSPAASIPSSPTSVHSSSSAIFERDIEPVASHPSHHAHSPNPHRIPRAKTTEQLEQSVPSVLDQAASILTGLQDADQVAVETPARAGSGSGMVSPIGSMGSRSPSPGAGTKGSLLLSIPHHSTTSPPHTQSVSPTSPTSAPGAKPQPKIQTNIPSPAAIPAHVQDTPSIVTPTSAYFSTSSSIESSPTTTTKERAPELPDTLYRDSDSQDPEGMDVDSIKSPIAPLAPPPSAIEPSFGTPPQSHAFTFSQVQSLAPSSPQSSSSPPHSITSSPRQTSQQSLSNSSKRLSFMSYSDLLTSTPASTLPLSSLMTSNVEPPHHLPLQDSNAPGPLSGASRPGSAAVSLRGFPLDPSHGHPFVQLKEKDSILDDLVGGEWQREGFGKGLEERLEAIVGGASSASVKV